MFRLIKLAMMALMGYAIYEFFRGVTHAQSAPSGGNRGRNRKGQSGQNAPHLGSGNQQFSGAGEGQRVETEDVSGTSTPHYVGRGVVSR